MPLTLRQLLFGIGVLLIAGAWYLDLVTRCHGCRRRFALRPGPGRRVEGRGRVQREWTCRHCGWSTWKNEHGDSHDHAP